MAERLSYDGAMAARVDRLPLTRVRWQLAVLVEVTWGFIIFDTDSIGARLLFLCLAPQPHQLVSRTLARAVASACSCTPGRAAADERVDRNSLVVSPIA